MWPAVYSCALVFGASCYSPAPITGAPCTPDRGNCPSGQTCELVAGTHVCVSGSGLDATPVRPWTLVQTRASTNLRRVSISASGAARLIVVAVETNASAVASVTDDAGTTYVPIAESRAVEAAESFGIELWYAASSNAGATTISAVADVIYAMAAWEVAGIRTTNPLDTASKLDNQLPTTNPVGASLRTSADGEFVVSVAIVSNEISGLTAGSPFTNDHTAFGNGWAHLTSASAPAGTYQARWDQPERGSSCAASAAFFVGP
jgi:hypothetical protein